jgi:uncharacterized membrane protein YfcA
MVAADESPVRGVSLWAITLRKLVNGLGWMGVLLIVYGAVTAGTGSVWEPLERWVTPASSMLTLFGTVLTAASVYVYTANPRPPERFSRWISAPLVIVGCLVAAYVLERNGQLPPAIVNGFALIAIAGAFFRIQPSPAED